MNRSPLDTAAALDLPMPTAGAEAGRTPSPVRAGSITLVRHGEPALSRKIRLSAEDYRNWWGRYELGGLKADQSPPESLRAAVGHAGVVLSSTRRRAIESARILLAERTFESRPLFIEAPLPPPGWPEWIRLSPKLWGFFARFWWWWFDHHQDEESQGEADVRSRQAADELIGMAASGQDVVLIAHGFFNAMIARSLRRRGWRRTLNGGYSYWSAKRFEAPLPR